MHKIAKLWIVDDVLKYNAFRLHVRCKALYLYALGVQCTRPSYQICVQVYIAALSSLPILISHGIAINGEAVNIDAGFAD